MKQRDVAHTVRYDMDMAGIRLGRDDIMGWNANVCLELGLAMALAGGCSYSSNGARGGSSPGPNQRSRSPC
jgi:hypothetical protein